MSDHEEAARERAHWWNRGAAYERRHYTILLQRLAAVYPYVEVMTDWDAGELRCFFCHSAESDSHMPDCIWWQAFIQSPALAGDLNNE